MKTARILPDTRPTPATTPGTGAWSAACHVALRSAASLRLTLLLIVMLGAGVMVSSQATVQATPVLAVPLALLAINLGCAILTHPTFRTQVPLLAFHLALLAIVVLVAAGRLTYLKGHIELSDGQAFDGRLTEADAGPLHAHAIDAVRFVNRGFDVHYREGIRRAETVNRVTWIDSQGRAQAGTIGDSTPLVIDGYRIYTSFNKGFAPEFTWAAPGSSQAIRGTIHLPAYPAHEHAQVLEWTPPGADRPLWTMLELPVDVIDPVKPSVLRVPDRHKLIVRAGSERVELEVGDRAAIAGGVLTYEGLRMWMGYSVFHDWTVPWLLAAGTVAVLALAWHFSVRFRARKWWEESPEVKGVAVNGSDHAG